MCETSILDWAIFGLPFQLRLLFTDYSLLGQPKLESEKNGFVQPEVSKCIQTRFSHPPVFTGSATIIGTFQAFLRSILKTEQSDAFSEN